MARSEPFSRLAILDGAWGTELQKLGLQPGESCERLNLEAPEKVRQVAESYVAAGSDIILTNSFQGNPIVLARHGLADQTEVINRRAVEISRQAAGDRAKVFASIGPSGKILLMGEVPAEQLRAAFARQVSGLVAGRPDGIVLETFTDLEELRLVAATVREVTDVYLVGCLSFDSGPDRTRTIMGVSVEQAAAAAEEIGLDAVGANCGLGIEAYHAVARCYLARTRLPVWIKANAGLPERKTQGASFRQSPEEFARHARGLAEMGVRFLGGCCGTTPAHIRELVKLRT